MLTSRSSDSLLFSQNEKAQLFMKSELESRSIFLGPSEGSASVKKLRIPGLSFAPKTTGSSINNEDSLRMKKRFFSTLLTFTYLSLSRDWLK